MCHKLDSRCHRPPSEHLHRTELPTPLNRHQAFQLPGPVLPAQGAGRLLGDVESRQDGSPVGISVGTFTLDHL